jgi:hypothetical protein
MLEFFVWMVDQVENPEECELNILGDVFHKRDKISVDTINYAISGVEYLAEHFPQVNIIVGNHDMFHRDRIDVNSVNMFKHIKNVRVIGEMIHEGDVVYTPWIVDQKQYDDLIKYTKKHKVKYIFGHFEFSTFRLNDNYIMEHGMTHKSLKHIDKIFTGHYHGRQEVDNVIYVGNPFPYDYNDANDSAKGFCEFDKSTGEHTFTDYNTIEVTSIDYNDFLEADFTGTEDMDFSKDSLRIVINNDISDEDFDKLRETLESRNFRDTKIVYKRSAAKNVVEENTELSSDRILTVDETVLEHIKNIDESNTTVNKNLLASLYQEIIE